MTARIRDSARKLGGAGHRHCFTILSFLLLLSAFIMTASSFAGAIFLSSTRGGELIELKFEAGDFLLTNVSVNGELCAAITLNEAAGSAITLTKGLPALPYYTASVAIPGTAAMGLEIVGQTVTELRVNKIVPSKGSITRNVDPATVPYTFGDFYARDEWYPRQTVTLGEPYCIRNVRGLVVTCYPFQYNAKTGILKVTTSIVVRVKQTGTSAVNALTTRDMTIAPAFENLYERHFINFDRVRSRYTYVPDGDKMIVIAPSSLKSAVQPLVDWKNQKGIATTLYEYPSQTGSGAALTTFIQGKYASDKIAYILLVGEAADIPSLRAGEGLSDVSYTKLKGSDNYPDAFIGRFCSSKASDITALVEKTIKYEKSPDPAGAWYTKATGIGSEFGSPSDQEFMEKYRKVMEPYGYTAVDKIYGESASKSALITALNEGRSWVDYMGHGDVGVIGTTEFGNSDVASLKNAGKPFLMTIVACLCGKFDETCLGEVITNAAGKGALACAASYISQPWDEPQWTVDEMVMNLLVKDKCLSYGCIFYNGECAMLDKGGEALKTYYAWTLFGDPSVMQFTKTPKAISVTPPVITGKGAQQVAVTLSEAVTGRVALYDPTGKRLLGSALLTTASSSATIGANIPDDVQSVTLTVTAFNRVPTIQEIAIHTGPYLQAKLDSLVYWAGSQVPVKWTAGGGANVATVKIDYSTDNGQTWVPVIASTPAAAGSYTWTVPDVNESNQCKIKISEVGGSGLAGTSPLFTIKQKAHINLPVTIEKKLHPNDSSMVGFKVSNTGKGTLTFAITSHAGGGGSTVVINEIYAGSTGFNGIELWNSGNDRDLSGWKVTWKDNKNSGGAFTFPQNKILKRNKTAVLMDSSKLASDSMLYSGKNMAWKTGTTRLSIALTEGSGKGVDFVRTANNTDEPPAGTQWNGDGITLDKKGAYRASAVDSNAASDWKTSDSYTINALNPGQTAAAAPGWLSVVSPLTDTVLPLKDTTIMLKCNAASLAEGTYYDTITFAHNDPDKASPAMVICKLLVSNSLAVEDRPGSEHAVSLNVRRAKSAVYFAVTGPASMRANLKIFDLLGHLVYEQSGARIAPWRYTNGRGARIAKRTYVATVKIFDRDRAVRSETFTLGIE